MAPHDRPPRKYGEDIFVVVLAAIAFGLASLPIVVLLGGDGTAVAGIAGAYGLIGSVVAPLVSKQRRGSRDDDDTE